MSNSQFKLIAPLSLDLSFNNVNIFQDRIEGDNDNDEHDNNDNENDNDNGLLIH